MWVGIVLGVVLFLSFISCPSIFYLVFYLEFFELLTSVFEKTFLLLADVNVCFLKVSITCSYHPTTTNHVVQ